MNFGKLRIGDFFVLEHEISEKKETIRLHIKLGVKQGMILCSKDVYLGGEAIEVRKIIFT